MSIKLQGKWYVSIYDEKQTSTYPDATEIEILESGNWVRFISADGMIHMTSFPVSLRTKLGSFKAGQIPGALGEGV